MAATEPRGLRPRENRLFGYVQACFPWTAGPIRPANSLARRVCRIMVKETATSVGLESGFCLLKILK